MERLSSTDTKDDADGSEVEDAEEEVEVLMPNGTRSLPTA
jgi:hypothetical protein